MKKVLKLFQSNNKYFKIKDGKSIEISEEEYHSLCHKPGKSLEDTVNEKLDLIIKDLAEIKKATARN